jgi:outer membrane protein
MRIWIVFVLIFALAAQTRPELPSKLTLEAAMEMAFRNATLLRRAEAELEQAEGQAGQARSALMPQVSLALNDTVQSVNLKAMGIDIPFAPSRVGPFQSVDARALFALNVFNWQARERDRAGRAQVSSSAAMRDNARELLAMQVAVQFAQVVRAQKGVATLNEQWELSRKLLGLTEERYRGGVASLMEVKRSQQQVNHLEQSLLEARNGLTASKVQLANLLQARVSSEFEVEARARVLSEAPDADRLMREALEARSDHRAALELVRAAEHRVASVKAQRYPVIQFQADYGQSGRKPFENLNTFHVRGVLSVPLFTGGRIAGEEAEAEGKVKEARAMLDEIRSQVEADVLTAVAAWEAARGQVEVAGRTVGLAREELELASERFGAGVADNTEVVNAQERLSRAEDNRVRAEYQAGVAEAQLYRASGGGEKHYRRRIP